MTAKQPDAIDELTKKVLGRINEFTADLAGLGVERIFLRHNYSHTSSVTKGRRKWQGRTVISYKHKDIDLVIQTYPAKLESEEP